MILELLSSGEILKPKLIEYLKIVNNSSTHLQNVIEDALDISRLENNSFLIFKEMFDVRKAVKEVLEIMQF